MPNKKKVKVWLFPVSDTPQDLLNEKPTPSSWDMKPTTIQMTYEKNNKNSQDDDNENDYLNEQSLKYKLIDAAEGILNYGFNVGIELSYYEDSEEDDNNDEEKKQSGNNNNKNNYINNSINDDKLQTDDADDIFHSPTAITNMCVLSVPGAFWEISYLKVYQNNLPKPKNNAKIDESENDEQTDHRTTPSSSTMRNNNSNNNSQNSPDWRSLFKGACEDDSADTNNNVDKTNKDSPTALVDNLKEQLAKLTNTNNKNLLTPLPTTLNLPTLNLSSPPNLTQALKLDPSSLQNDLEAKYNDLTAQTKKTFEDFQEKLSGLINTKPPCADPLDLSDLGINKSAVNDLLTLNPSDLPALLGTLSVSNKRDVNDALAVCNRFVNKGRKLLSSNLNIHNNVECIEDTKKGNNNAIQQNNKNEKEEENEQSTYSSSPSYPAIATSLSSSLTQDKEKNATYLEEEKHEHIKTVGIELPIMQRLRRLMTEEKRESVLEKKHDVRTLVSSTSRSHSPAYKEEESNEDEEQSYRNGFSAASRRLQVVTPSFPRVARSLHGSPHLLVSYVPLALLSLGQKVEGGKHLIGSAVAKGVENRVEAAHNVRYTAADLLENSIPAAVIAGAGVGTPSRSFSLHGEGVDMLSPKLLTGGNGDDMQPLTLVGNDIQMPINEEKYTAVLSKTDIQTKKNSFYKLQLLAADSGSKYWVFRSWGRIGTTIGGNKVEKFDSLQAAKLNFCQLYEEKTGNMWEQRSNFIKVPGLFYPIDIDYGEDEEVKSMDITESTSTLPPPVQELMHMIFDVKAMQKVMLEFELDTEKMPLGKLSKKQIQSAYSVLTELQQLIDSKGAEARLIDASNRFYTFVPHSFGIEDPPILNDIDMIKQKIAMLDSLMELEIAYSLMKSSGSDKTVDGYYKQLNTDINVLDKESEEFKTIQEYVSNTHAATHSSYSLEVIDVFTIKRQGEDKRFKPFKKLHNHKLLWHGSRTTNFAGIFSQGLRIAPPEAPVTGYMFGKGIYFADMVSKSANYCCTTPSNSTGLLLLCDVALGNMYERTRAEYVEKLPKGKHSTKGLGRTEPDPNTTKIIDGVEVPLGKGVTKSVSSDLLYNEYIVYDVAQVNIKYLLKVEFKYKY